MQQEAGAAVGLKFPQSAKEKPEQQPTLKKPRHTVQHELQEQFRDIDQEEMAVEVRKKPCPVHQPRPECSSLFWTPAF